MHPSAIQAPTVFATQIPNIFNLKSDSMRYIELLMQKVKEEGFCWLLRFLQRLKDFLLLAALFLDMSLEIIPASPVEFGRRGRGAEKTKVVIT